MKHTRKKDGLALNSFSRAPARPVPPPAAGGGLWALCSPGLGLRGRLSSRPGRRQGDERLQSPHTSARAGPLQALVQWQFRLEPSNFGASPFWSDCLARYEVSVSGQNGRTKFHVARKSKECCCKCTQKTASSSRLCEEGAQCGVGR